MSSRENIILYTTPGCPFCATARQELAQEGTTFQEISVENNPEATEAVMRLSNGTGIVPILISGDDVRVGFGGG